MKIFKSVATIGYWITVTAGLALGIAYSLSTRIMPYHLQAMDSTWEGLYAGAQWMTLNFMRSAGTGFIATSIAAIFILFKPFKRSELWSYIAIFIVTTTQFGLIFARSVSVMMHTNGEPPLLPMIIILIVISCSFITSIISYKLERRRI